MRIYIAAPWKYKEDIQAVSERLEDAGHTITHKWWLTEDVPEHDRTAAVLKQQAVNDVAGVKNANIVLVINSAKSEGKALEQGIAVGDGKPIVCIGKRGEFSQNVFHYLDNYKWVDSVDDAIKVLDTIQFMQWIQYNGF